MFLFWEMEGLAENKWCSKYLCWVPVYKDSVIINTHSLKTIRGCIKKCIITVHSKTSNDDRTSHMLVSYQHKPPEHFHDQGTPNVCMPCHPNRLYGRNNGNGCSHLDSQFKYWKWQQCKLSQRWPHQWILPAVSHPSPHIIKPCK